MDDRIERALADLRRLRQGNVPSAAELADAPFLDNWFRLGPYLAGCVSGQG